MIKSKRWIRNFFGFSRSQAQAFLILLPLMVLLIFSEPLWRWWITSRPINTSDDKAMLDSLIAVWDEGDNTKGKPMEEKMTVSLFAFNPNQASVDELQSLGFSKALANRILHYRQKGGVFKVKSDVLKMYGVDTAFYQQLYAFIELPTNLETKPKFETKHEAFVKKTITKFNLNSADTTQLKSVYGIGEKLSLRIVKFRNALGGFISANQLAEIYGLDSVVVNRLIKVSFIEDGFRPVQLNINVANEKDLALHPYLSTTVAKAIVAYRFQHGQFKTVEDIGNIQGVDAETIQKIAPYLKCHD